MVQTGSAVLVTAFIQALSVAGVLSGSSGWLAPSVLAALIAGILSAGVGLLLFVAYLRTNRLQKKLIDLTSRQQAWLEETKDPKLLYRSAALRKFQRSQSFVIELEFLNPGEVPIQIEEAISGLDEGRLGTADYTRKRREYRTAEPRQPFKTELTVIEPRAQEPPYWPTTAKVTIKYVAARTKLFSYRFSVHPRTDTEAFLMVTDIEDSGSTAGTG